MTKKTSVDRNSGSPARSPVDWIAMLESYRNACEQRHCDIGHLAAVNDLLCREQGMLNRHTVEHLPDFLSVNQVLDHYGVGDGIRGYRGTDAMTAIGRR